MTRPLAPTLLFAVLLTGCPTRPDTDSSERSPTSVPIDRAAPTVVSTTPAPGAANVVLRAPIEIRFSEPILASSFTPSAVSLQIDGVAVGITAIVSSDGTRAAIAINDLTAFSLPATFSVTLAATITDLAGNALAAPAAAWSWNVPDWIKYAPLPGYHSPLLAVGPDFQPIVGRTACAGNSGGGCTYPLSVTVANDDLAWKDLGQLNNVFGPGSLDLDAQGHPIVAGTGKDPTTDEATVIVTTWNGSGWDSSTPALPVDASFGLPNPIVRFDPSGQPVVAWIESTSSTQSDVSVARWTGTRWDQSFGLLGLPAVTSHALIFDSSGNPIVGWNRSSYQSGFSAWNGTTWMPPRANIFTNEPFVALDQALDPIMIDGSVATVVDHYRDGAWTQMIPAPVPVGNYGQYPHLTVTPDHKPVVGWIDTSGPAKVGLARWTGGQWDTRAGLFNAGAGVSNEAPAVVVDARGVAWVAWREGTAINIWMSNY